MRDDQLFLTAYVGGLTSLLIFLMAGGSSTLTQAFTNVAHVSEAAAFFSPSISSTQLQSAYHEKSTPDPVTGVAAPVSSGPIRILIVPGHQPDKGGTDFRGVYERDVVVDIADALASLLAQNPRYEVTVARDKTQWTPVLATYFSAHADDIASFEATQKAQMAQYVSNGNVLSATDQVYHTFTNTTAALQLYGINKWASDTGVSLTIHLHLNDDADHRAGRPGAYSGFAIYVPDAQYSNAEASHAVAEAIAARLNAYHATSTLRYEDQGVVPDQSLIAVGSNNSANSAALLIEYGYIYEPQFLDTSSRSAAVADYAYETYQGIQDFMKDPVAGRASAVLPYDWSGVTGAPKERGAGVYALQTALRTLGYYPPSGRSLSDCPISGLAGACTSEAVAAYQRAHGLEATGVLGPKTRAVLADAF